LEPQYEIQDPEVVIAACDTSGELAEVFEQSVDPFGDDWGEEVREFGMDGDEECIDCKD
jgi:hypothetical protein